MAVPVEAVPVDAVSIEAVRTEKPRRVTSVMAFAFLRTIEPIRHEITPRYHPVLPGRIHFASLAYPVRRMVDFSDVSRVGNGLESGFPVACDVC